MEHNFNFKIIILEKVGLYIIIQLKVRDGRILDVGPRVSKIAPQTLPPFRHLISSGSWHYIN